MDVACEGLEGERKWMSDTVSVAGECLLSPFCQDTQHGRELRERVIAGDAGAAGQTVPEVFTSVLQEAAMKAGLAGDKRLLHVNAPHSKEVFRATIRGICRMDRLRAEIWYIVC
jgi:hypothetical protein